MSNLFDAIMALPIPFNMVVIIVIIGCLAGVITGVISTIAKETRHYLCHRNEMDLKREMLDRGMESWEIEKVMQASTDDMKKPPCAPMS